MCSTNFCNEYFASAKEFARQFQWGGSLCHKEERNHDFVCNKYEYILQKIIDMNRLKKKWAQGITNKQVSTPVELWKVNGVPIDMFFGNDKIKRHGRMSWKDTFMTFSSVF